MDNELEVLIDELIMVVRRETRQNTTSTIENNNETFKSIYKKTTNSIIEILEAYRINKGEAVEGIMEDNRKGLLKIIEGLLMERGEDQAEMLLTRRDLYNLLERIKEVDSEERKARKRGIVNGGVGKTEDVNTDMDKRHRSRATHRIEDWIHTVLQSKLREKCNRDGDQEQAFADIGRKLTSMVEILIEGYLGNMQTSNRNLIGKIEGNLDAFITQAIEKMKEKEDKVLESGIDATLKGGVTNEGITRANRELDNPFQSKDEPYKGYL